MPLPDFSPLPEMGVASDMVAGVIVCDDAILFLRHMAHAGTHLRLPGGWRVPSESLEESCRRLVIEELRRVVREFARQLRVPPEDEAIAIEVGQKIGEHPVGRLGRMHYFLVSGRGQALFAGPSIVPAVEPTRLVWTPYVWVRVPDLGAHHIQPVEALEIFEKIRKRAIRVAASD